MLVYTVVDDYVNRRIEFRAEHLGLAQAAAERGELVYGGAAGDPVDRAWLLFKGESDSVARSFAISDPYVLNGLVKEWEVVPWHIVVSSTSFNLD